MATGSIHIRKIASLNHEVVNDSMENCVIVISILC